MNKNKSFVSKYVFRKKKMLKLVYGSLLFMLFCHGNAMDINIVTIEQPEHHRVLKTAAKKITFPLSKEEIELIKAMKKKLYELEGVGLAAPQVNKGKRIIAVYIPEKAAILRDNITTYPVHIMINPSYKPINENALVYDFEGCYSVSSKMGKVPRYEQIQVTYYDEKGIFHQQIEKGFYARVLQHEIDHLQGILITDRLTKDCIQGTLKEMMALRRAELPDDKKVILDALIAKKLKK